LWRHNEAGDLPGEGDDIDVPKLRALVQANRGKRGFTYTHKPVLDNPQNAVAIKCANQNGFTVNLSADSIEEGLHGGLYYRCGSFEAVGILRCVFAAISLACISQLVRGSPQLDLPGTN